MTKHQLSTAITSLLATAKRECDQSAHSEGNVWIAQMTAAKVLMGLAQALIEVRDNPGGKAPHDQA